jgi:hypothetical protein
MYIRDTEARMEFYSIDTDISSEVDGLLQVCHFFNQRQKTFNNF